MTAHIVTEHRRASHRETFIAREPYYLAVGKEIELFEAAYKAKFPVMLKGPTGCGKTRFIEYMAWRLSRPLITVACHEDLSATDLVGRFLLEGDETVWHDGPLTTAVKHGAICYLDEVVEARKDTIVLIHPLTDDRRILADRKARHDSASARRVPACRLLQSRLSERAQRPETINPPAIRRDGIRLPARAARDGDSDARRQS